MVRMRTNAVLWTLTACIFASRAVAIPADAIQGTANDTALTPYTDVLFHVVAKFHRQEEIRGIAVNVAAVRTQVFFALGQNFPDHQGEQTFYLKDTVDTYTILRGRPGSNLPIERKFAVWGLASAVDHFALLRMGPYFTADFDLFLGHEQVGQILFQKGSTNGLDSRASNATMLNWGGRNSTSTQDLINLDSSINRRALSRTSRLARRLDLPSNPESSRVELLDAPRYQQKIYEFFVPLSLGIVELFRTPLQNPAPSLSFPNPHSGPVCLFKMASLPGQSSRFKVLYALTTIDFLVSSTWNTGFPLSLNFVVVQSESDTRIAAGRIDAPEASTSTS